MKKFYTSSVSEQDREIILGLGAGDRQALDKLYTIHYPSVLHMVTKNSGSNQEAEDLFQDAVLVLYDKAKSGDFELNCRLNTYIYSVCRRLWLKQLKLKNRLPSESYLEGHSLEFVDLDIQEHLETEAQFQKMKQALSQLGDPCQNILQDFYIRGMSMQQIGEKYGYTNADNAKNQKYKCLQRLKKFFFQHDKQQ